LQEADREIALDEELPLAERQAIVAAALGNGEQHDAAQYLNNVRARFDRSALFLSPRASPLVHWRVMQASLACCTLAERDTQASWHVGMR
jgi:hypothetical protein